MASQMVVRTLYQRGSSLLIVNNSMLSRAATVALVRSPMLQPLKRFYSGKHFDDQPTEEIHEEDNEFFGWECSPNWELLSPACSRFCLPNKVGLAYADLTSLGSLSTPLRFLIDFDGRQNQFFLKIHMMPCPKLLQHSVENWFPALKNVIVQDLCLITLQYFGTDGRGEEKFALAASEIAVNLCRRGYWADFINPFNAKPLFSFRDINDFATESKRRSGSDVNDTVVLGAHGPAGCSYCGNIYTNASFEYMKQNVATLNAGYFEDLIL